ncbi:adenosine receptor A2a-like [Pocillopora verrucosa]|uniref:adenosine receptor A2a-like n=1 Tax=Pocillopora verrucosa TaxID=203993 RepID=UPI00333EA1C4
MSTTNFSSGRSRTESFKELLCSPSLVGGLQQQLSICFVAVDILFSITAFAGNSLILVALHKKSCLHPQSKLLLVGLVAQPLDALCWISVVQEHWSLCRYARDAASTTGRVLSLVSLMTMTAISVDRLLALMLGLRYKQIVTLKRTYYQAQVRDQQQPSQTNALNMARFRKAVYSALWVQLALAVCYAPICIVNIVIAHTKKYSFLLVVICKVAVIILCFNSTLNPFLYCWKIREVRQAVKQTIKEALC